MNVCELDPDEIPEQGENERGVPWSEVKTKWEKMCGVTRDEGAINMSPDELRSWEDHDCADQKSVRPQEVRDRVYKVLETHPRDWESEGSWKDDDPKKMGHLEIATKINAFNARGYGSWNAMERYGDGWKYKDFDGLMCPNGWAIACLNWGQDPDREYEEFYR